MTRRHSTFDSFVILNGSSTTLHTCPPGLPHHATHTHEARSSCLDHAAHSSSIDLRRERVVAEAREQPIFLCGAASNPAGASRQRATHVFAACRPRRAPIAACYRTGCWGVLECSAFPRANDRLVSAEFGVDVHGRHQSPINPVKPIIPISMFFSSHLGKI